MATEEVKIKALLENDEQVFPATHWKACEWDTYGIVILMDSSRRYHFGR